MDTHSTSTSRSSAAGFSGLGMAIRLRAGGRSTTSSCSSAATTSAAPGATTPIPAAPATCPSHLYSFSFAPNPDWSAHLLARSPRSAPTCARVADELRRAPAHPARLRGRAGATWDEDAALGDRDLARATLRARVLVAGIGPADRAEDPGPARASSTFAGPVFHSARWDHDRRPRAASASPSIGTGASAIQFVPADPAARSRSCTSSSARRRGSMPHTDRPITRARAARSTARVPAAAAARARRRSTRRASCSCSASSSSRG